MVIENQYHISSFSSILGNSPTSILLGLTKIAWPGLPKKQWKPSTVPFPPSGTGSSSSIPRKNPQPMSSARPMKRISPRLPFSSWHLCPTCMVSARVFRQSGSQIQTWFVRGFLALGFSSRNTFFHFLKFQGRLSQVSSDITYFQIVSVFSISLWMELGFRSMMYTVMSDLTPQKSSDLISSSMLVTTLPSLFLRTSLTQLGSEPYLLSMFSFRARMVTQGSTLSSGILRLDRLCSRFILMLGAWAIVWAVLFRL